MEKVRKFVQNFYSWTQNIKVYQRFGDFRDKCVHDGTNLTGTNPKLASEYLLIRAYRSSLTFLGAVFDEDMYLSAGDTLVNADFPLKRDPKPGVYTPFLNAYFLDIGIYKLGLDKVHSDYGGVPMKVAPGSRLENGTQPIIDSKNANVTIANLAALFFQPQILPLKFHYEVL
ncbi:hypothetical protein AHMF7605_20890 [Adhaeribacter arboris]|uniref:Uncharacterized protein n=2 Tax=Adhaeribacter arboris TaxID=2072846 RepID=A0A2T2YPF3_9BACT|nr:hypothetical protein AHMF7605_20890 [Adhaeribacter arboris]